jgi:hypothetical protein
LPIEQAIRFIQHKKFDRPEEPRHSLSVAFNVVSQAARRSYHDLNLSIFEIEKKIYFNTCGRVAKSWAWAMCSRPPTMTAVVRFI